MGLDLGNLISTGIHAASGIIPGGSTVTTILTGGLSLLGGQHGKPGHEKPDITTVAQRNGITFDQANAVIAYRESHVDDNFDTLASQAARIQSDFIIYLNEYNAAHPNSQVILNSYQESSPQPAQAAQPAQQPAQATQQPAQATYTSYAAQTGTQQPAAPTKPADATDKEATDAAAAKSKKLMWGAIAAVVAVAVLVGVFFLVRKKS